MMLEITAMQMIITFVGFALVVLLFVFLILKNIKGAVTDITERNLGKLGMVIGATEKVVIKTAADSTFSYIEEKFRYMLLLWIVWMFVVMGFWK